MKKIEILKRMAAGALAVAIIALGTSCGKTTEPVCTTTSKLVFDPVTPSLRADILSDTEIEATSKLAGVVKTMINEDRLYASNFDYYVENVVITGLSLEAVNPVHEDVMADYAPSTQTKVTVSYVADAVNKTTGEKSTVSNVISYVVNSEELSAVAQADSEQVAIEEVAEKVSDTTIKKLENEGVSEQDEVKGRQSSPVSRFSNDIVSRFVEKYYETPEIKKYIDDGFQIITTTQEVHYLNCYQPYVERFTDKVSNDLSIGVYLSYCTPNGRIQLSQNLEDKRSKLLVLYCFTSLVVNPTTGEQRLIKLGYANSFTISDAEFNNILNYARTLSLIDYDKLAEAELASGKEVVKLKETINGEEGFTDEVYEMIDQMIVPTNSYMERWGSVYGYSDVDVNDVNNYKDKILIMSLADKNNTDVFIKEPNN